MSEQTPLPVKVGPGEKSAGIMVYLPHGICWGDVVVKEQIRASTWLRTNSAPEYVCIYNAKMLMTTAGGQPRSIMYPELHIPVSYVQAMHLLPPAKDPPDYDTTEPNRKMEPVTVFSGTFKMDGNVRMASQFNLARFLEITHVTFLSLYDVDISCLTMPALGVMKVSFAIIRQTTSSLAARLP
jgi:hypothetical protein